jgi:hypothetical protein
MISDSEKKSIISKIFLSSEFRDSKRYQDLLKYLIDESSKNITIKETTIAHEVFGKDSKFDPSEDPLVRVYISNLRKKLEHYYLTTEDTFSYKLEIPKGQYTVQFTHLNPISNSKKIAKHPYFFFLPIIVLLLSIILIQMFTGKKQTKEIQTNFVSSPLWSEFIQPDSKPTMVVFGDYLFMFEKGNIPGGGYFVRDPRINSEEDFRAALKQKPEMINKFVLANFTFLRPSTAWSLAEILPILWNSPNKIYLKLASQFKWEDFQTHNVIFIGSFKTLYKFNQLLLNFNIKYNPVPATLNILGEKGDTLKSFSPKDLKGGNYQKDYGVILKQQGLKGNTILYLLGFDEVGIIEAAKTVVDQEFISKVEKFSLTKLSSSSFFFEMVIEAEGVEQTGFRSEIKYFKLFSAPQSITK